MTGVKDQLMLDLDKESYHVALKQADMYIFQKSLGCVSFVKKIVWKMKNTLFHCSFYSYMRYKLIQKAINFNNNFLHLQTDEQFRTLMDDDLIKDTEDCLHSAYSLARNAVYK